MNTRHLAIHHAVHRKQAPPNIGTARLTYYIFEGILVGFANGKQIYLAAYSGGAGGSKVSTATEIANNPYSYGVKEIDIKASKTHKPFHSHGGPIPPGTYEIKPPIHHNKLGYCAPLDPEQKLPNERGGFAIHGMGPHGSDGCIVIIEDPENRSVKIKNNAKLQRLMTDLTATKGGRLVVLESPDGRFA